MRRKENGEILDASVKLIFEGLNEDIIIVRVRGKHENSYILNDKKFTGFGSEVPAPIKQILGTMFIKLGNVELCPVIAGVDNPLPFLVYESAPTRGSLLNYLTGIDIAEKIKKTISREICEKQNGLHSIEASLSSHRVELKTYNGVEEQFVRCQELRGQFDSLAASVAQYEKAIADLELLESSSTEINRLATLIEQLGSCLAAAANACTQRRLLDALTEASAAFNKYAAVAGVAQRLEGLETALNAFLKNGADINNMLETCHMLVDIEDRMEDIEKSKAKTQEQLSKYQLIKCKECGNLYVADSSHN
jgi:hypothetical protein